MICSTGNVLITAIIIYSYFPSSQANKELETEQQLNSSLRENKKEWVSKIVDLERTVKEKDEVISFSVD